MTEFALLLPVFLLILGAALDLGRLFYAHVAIENAAKEGALYGATNPRCDGSKEGCRDPNTVSWLVENESVGIPDVTYDIACLRNGDDDDDDDDDDDEGNGSRSVNDCRPGDAYRVRVESEFRFVTPIFGAELPFVGRVFGPEHLDLRSSATSLVSVGAFDPDAPVIPGPTPTPQPTPTPAPTPTQGPGPTPSGTPGPGPTPSRTPGPGPTPTATPSATPQPNQCTVPNLIGVKVNSADDDWRDAGFTGSLSRRAGAPNGNFTVGYQSLTPGSTQSCTSMIQVDD